VTALSSLLSSCASAILSTRPGDLPRVEVALCFAVVAKPVAVRHNLETDTVGMPQFLTAIAVHENIFIVIFSAGLTGLIIVVFVGDLEEHGRV
jgi:hypothetical protein